MNDFDVAVLGGGPAGMAAALAAHAAGARVLLIEREDRLGGILKQCIHDGFGLVRFGRKLAGPEYAQYFIDKVRQSSIEVALQSFASRIRREEDGVHLTLVSRSGLRQVRAAALVLATGCRERTARQVAIHGDRPAGIFTAGSAQYYVNLLGKLPAKRCVILGSGDIGLIMARRLTLEGAQVLGVYEAKPTPSGLARNISQCLTDFDIPLYTSQTVTRVFGRQRVEAVEIAQVDEHMTPIPGTEQRLSCDCLILSVGLIPENELAESMDIPLDRLTKGPVCDQSYQTLADGVFACGNALHVNDLVDYVSESGEGAGKAAAAWAAHRPAERELVNVVPGKELLYCVPQRLDVKSGLKQVVFFFRSRQERGRTRLNVLLDGKAVHTKLYSALRPPEMERLTLDLSGLALRPGSEIHLELEEVQQ